jgi:hypothetical protein
MDDLARAGIGELTRMYREALAPSSLDALHGTPRGRMLAVTGPLGRGPARRAVAALARAPFFPWIGKRFEAHDDRSGQGINRVRLLGERYRFDLRFDQSVLDGERCVLLDYDVPDNPFFIRPIRDELREVSPGLFLGPALLRTRTEPRLVLFFAVEARCRLHDRSSGC